MCRVLYLIYAGHPFIHLVQCDIAAVVLLLSAWVRYAGTARSLPKGGAYALIIIGQVGMHPETPLFLSVSCLLRRFLLSRNQYSRF
jgi:hypothetical protein